MADKPRSLAVGEMAWKLLRAQTVYRCNLTAIALAHSSREYRISARDISDFCSEREQSFPARGSNCFAAGSATEKSNKKNNV